MISQDSYYYAIRDSHRLFGPGDDSSRLTSRTDDNGNVTVYQYDPLGRMTAEVFADCTQTSYVYDVHDNPITITDANGSTGATGGLPASVCHKC